MRRWLMLKQMKNAWENVDFNLNSFSSSEFVRKTYDPVLKTLTISNTNTKNPYLSSDASFLTSPGYEYKIEYDLDYVSGAHKIATRNAGNGICKALGTFTDDAHIVFTFLHDNGIVKLSLFPSFGINVLGEFTIRNFSIKRRKSENANELLVVERKALSNGYGSCWDGNTIDFEPTISPYNFLWASFKNSVSVKTGDKLTLTLIGKSGTVSNNFIVAINSHDPTAQYGVKYIGTKINPGVIGEAYTVEMVAADISFERFGIASSQNITKQISLTFSLSLNDKTIF